MSRLSWRSAPRGDLALLLKTARLDDSRAVGTSTVYQINVDGQDMVAVSMPDGQTVLVELDTTPNLLRRRLEV